MNLPNSLTILRIFFIPVLVVVLLTREPNVVFFGFPTNFAEWGVLILLAAAATDWADGYYARRRSEVTTLGILLDPIADKLLMTAAFISLVEMHLVQGWMAVIIIGREIVVLGLRNIASAEGFTIPASALGKTKMVLQVIAVCAVILAAKHAFIRPVGVALLWLVVGSAVVSAFQYFQKFWGRVDGSVKQRRHLRILERRKNAQDVPTSSELSRDDGAALIVIARRAISSAVIENSIPDFPAYPPALGISRGAFVSLFRSGRLRGCVGQAENPGPLAEVVARCAVLAALHDPRFPPVGNDEIRTLDIELSILSPLERFKSDVTPDAIADSVVIGRHGLMVVRERSTGLLLPQVAAERRWTGRRFLDETCAKAGLPRDAWRQPETQVFGFTAEVFSEAGSRLVSNP